MKSSMHLRKSARLLVLVAVVTGLLIPAAPAPATSHESNWSLSTDPVSFKRGGVTYRLTVSAHESFRGEGVSVTISRSRNPKGVRLATQSHTYSFDVDGAFDQANNLSSAKIATRKQLGKYGKLNLTFAKNAKIRRSCNGGIKTRTGTISGSLELKTGTKRFGTITNRPARGTLTMHDATADCGGPTTFPCPPPGRGVSGFNEQRRLSWNVNKANGANFTTVNMFWFDELDSSGLRHLIHSLDARVPNKRVKIAKNLSTATIRGAKKTWLSGESTFEASAPAERSQPGECGKAKESIHTFRPGNVTGTFKAGSFLGKGVRVRGSQFVTAQKITVRAR